MIPPSHALTIPAVSRNQTLACLDCFLVPHSRSRRHCGNCGVLLTWPRLSGKVLECGGRQSVCGKVGCRDVCCGVEHSWNSALVPHNSHVPRLFEDPPLCVLAIQGSGCALVLSGVTWVLGLGQDAPVSVCLGPCFVAVRMLWCSRVRLPARARARSCCYTLSVDP